MLAFVQILFQGIQDHLQMLFIPQEIGIADVHEYGLDIVLPDIMGIGLLDIEQVFVRDGLFVGPVPFSDILLQLAHGCMEIDQDIGLHQLLSMISNNF